MKKTGILLLIIVSLFALFSCSDSDLPEGMQLVYGSDGDGYFFYAPEEWTVSNVGEIKSAYASRIDVSSVSFAEVTASIPMPEGINKASYFFGDYFTDSLKEFPVAPTVTINAENTVFGCEGFTADKAIKYAFNYEYSGHKFGFMQILIQKGERFFILTYTAALDIKSGDKTYYDYYAEKVQNVINNFKFVERSSSDNKTEYKKDTDGYILISDSDLSGFELYVPETFAPDYSSAIVSATHADGSNVTVTEATSVGVKVSDYWEIRKKELSAIVSDIVEIEVGKPLEFGNANYAFSYEYTFVYNGEKYHVYQVFAVEGPMLFQKGYAFTYTAKEENYSAHKQEIENIIKKVDFK